MLLSESLRNAITASGQSVYKVSLATQVDENSLRRFVKGQTGLSQAALDRIGQHLGLTVVRSDKQAGGHELN